MGEAVVGDDFCAEGMDEFGDAVADSARADEADSLAFQFSADEAGLRAAGAAGCVYLGHVAEQVEDHGDGQFGDGNRRIARSVADFDAFGLSRFQIDVVDARKGNVDVFQVRAGVDDFAFQGHVGDDEDIGVLGFFDLDGRVVVAFVSGEFMALFPQRLYVRIEKFLADSQRFKQYNFHDVQSPFGIEIILFHYTHRLTIM